MKNSISLLRKRIFLVITLLIVLLIIYKYLSIMLIKTEKSENRLYNPSVERGPILDRNGRILAIQTRLYSVTAWIPSIRDIDKTADIVSEVLDLDRDRLKNELQSRSRFMYIKRKITNSDAEKIRVYLDMGELPGIGLQAEDGRSYPEKELASHLIGYTGTDNTGLEGIEYTYNNILSPSSSPGLRKKDIYGNQVFLTIDINIQSFAYAASLEAYRQYNADSVMLLVMEAKTGDILAYVSIPEVDINNFADAEESSRINRPLASAYEPGSVFKIFSIASLMEAGGIDENTLFHCNGFFEMNLNSSDAVRIRCLGTHGDVNAESIIKYSCNSGAAYAALTVPDSVFHSMLKNFDFGERTGIILPGETRGILRDSSSWSSRSKPTISFGQEISVSAVQMMKAATVFANQGVMLQPQIVSKIISHDGKTIDQSRREPLRQVLSPENAEKVLWMMVKASESGGTGWRAAVDGINMAVKTGTAQLLDKETGRYSEREFISSCLGVFPAEDPEIIIYNVIENPKKVSFFGGVIAAPVVGEVSDRIVSYLGIPRQGDRVIEHSGRITVRQPEVIALDDIIPDFTGMSKKQLLPLLADERVRVLINGEGWVVRQSPPEGTVVQENMLIELELE